MCWTLGCYGYDIEDIPPDPELMALQKQLVSVSARHRTQEMQLDAVQKKLKDLDLLKRDKTSTLHSKQALLKDLLSTLKTLTRHSKRRFLTPPQEYDQFIRTMVILRSLIRASLISHKNIEEDLEHFLALRKKIAQEKQRLHQTDTTLHKQALAIEVLLKKRQTLINKEIERRKRIEERVTRLAKQAKNIHDLMQNLSEEAPQKIKKTKSKTPEARGTSQRGRYSIAPIQGKCIVPFGTTSKDNPDGKGAVFASRSQAHVLCPLEAQVVFAGPFRAYKNIVILKHPSGHLTLFAGMDRLDVSVGQRLESGEFIGRMDASPQPKLYVELRKGGDFINPSSWFPHLSM